MVKVVRDWRRASQEGKDEVGGQHEGAGEEAGSFGAGFARGRPGRLQQVEDGMPGEGEEIEGRERHGEKLLAVPEIMFGAHSRGCAGGASFRHAGPWSATRTRASIPKPLNKPKAHTEFSIRSLWQV